MKQKTVNWINLGVGIIMGIGGVGMAILPIIAALL